MKNNLLFSIFCFLTLNVCGQSSPIMVCNASGTTCTPYSNIDSAYVYANNGDYIYLPGGVFILNVNIDKEVHLFGAGYSLDSAQITSTTIINGNITLLSNSNNTSVEGVYLTGSVVSANNMTLSNIQINHCNLHSISGLWQNSTIARSILRSTGYTENDLFNGVNNTITNCYVYNLTNINSSLVNQCVGLNFVNNINLTTIKNSIFNTYPNSPYNQPGANNSLIYNTYVYGCPYYCISLIYSSNNVQETYANLFANGLDYNSMKLIANSPALTSGENGGQVGVYGGLFPFKNGAVPSNPHIYQKNIAASTNANGELPVEIKVRAENY